jgi:aryl-alcohol dehydrogenase-like predicted oxidoreductase
VVKRQLGSAGPEITRVGFGAWAIGGTWLFGWGPADDDESVAAIRHAFEAGVNWIDTAAVYGFGHSEEVVGRAVEGYRVGEEVYVFTKCGRSWYASGGDSIASDLRPESIRFECEQSLKRLGLERIDLYQFHWPDWSTGTEVEDSWGTMAELVDEGKVRWLGVSNFTVELLERCEAIRHVDSFQPSLSMLNRGARAELIPWCRQNGTGVIVYSPMGSGLLTGAFDQKRLEGLAPDDWRRRAPHFQEPAFSQTMALVERLRPVAERLGTTLPALAVAWALAVPGVTGGIVGARRPAQIDSWLPAAELELDPDTVAEIEQALEETGAGTDAPPPFAAPGTSPPDRS